MKKQEFLENIRKEIKGLSECEVKERIAFYCEMLDDRIEDGLTEEEAVLEIGPISKVVSDVFSDISFIKIAKDKIRKKGELGIGTITLLALGSPIWLSLVISALAVFFSLFVSLWAVIFSVGWATFLALAASAHAGIFLGIVYFFVGSVPTALYMLSIGLVASGLTIYWFYASRSLTRLTFFVTKRTVILIKKIIIGGRKNA